MTDLQVHDVSTAIHRFRSEVVTGLRKPQKELPSKYFYDERGSQLFDRITELDEYYVTRAETELMQQHVRDMAEMLGEDILLIEYGSGSSIKTRILLSELQRPAGYVPIDISREYLIKAAERINEDYPHIDVYPVVADYTSMFTLPEIEKPVSKRVVYFPGSTIGNFDPLPAQQFLERIARVCGHDGVLLIGFDLKKDPLSLHKAYNDTAGITAAFNLNLLHRINRELHSDFDVNTFSHYAFYNAPKNRVEMHLVSERYQTVTIDDCAIPFRRGESIWTESSYKYNVDEFAELAAMAGFATDHVWFDDHERFAVACCMVEAYFE